MQNFFAILSLILLLSIGFPSCQNSKYKDKIKKEYFDKYTNRSPKEKRW